MTSHSDFLEVDQALSVLTDETGVPIYDFAFRNWFPCRSLWSGQSTRKVIARLGAFHDYEKQYKEFLTSGIQLIHCPEQHFLATRLPYWYKLIAHLTPRSTWYSELPTADQVEAEFRWPVFIKGERLNEPSFEVSFSREIARELRMAYRPVCDGQHSSLAICRGSRVCPTATS